jgi:PAS domain S-box-containing protein
MNRDWISRHRLRIECVGVACFGNGQDHDFLFVRRNVCGSNFLFNTTFSTFFTFTSHPHSILPSDEGKGEGLQVNFNQDAVLDAMPHHVWIAPSTSQKIEYFNHRWYEYTGLDQHQCKDGGASAIHPDDLELLTSITLKAQTFNHSYSVDVRIRGHNGAYRWFRVRGAPTYEDDHISAWVGTNTDIDESHRMRDELEMTHARLARLQAITTKLAMALTTADVTAVFVHEVVPFLKAHSGMLALLEDDGQRLRTLEQSGYRALGDQMIEQRGHVVNLKDPWPICTCFRQAKPLLIESQVAFVRAFPNLSEPLRQSGVQSVANLPLISEARPIGVMNLNFDQTTIFTPERLEFMTTVANLIAQALDRARLYDDQRDQAVMLEQRVQERTRELESHKQELEAFVYTVSHDLRVPLHKLLLSSELLTDAIAGKYSENATWLVEGIESGVHRMDQLIRDLLHLSRAGRSLENAVRVNLGETIDRVIGELEPTIQARGVLVHRAESWPEVTYPQTELYQIVLNLLCNAVRFAGHASRPEVRVAWVLEGVSIVFSIEDNGAGIPETQRGRVFELFAKLDPSGFGTGVGLAIVKRIAERHGGGIEVDESPLGGARFRVRIPQQDLTRIGSFAEA